MNAGPTAERVYDTLRSRILTGEYRPGDRLDPAVLADTLASSVTPVRDALHVLIGEGLVVTRTGGGFHLRALDAVGLAELYDWSADVADIMLRHIIGRRLRLRPAIPKQATIATLFEAIAAASTSAEHLLIVRSLNAALAIPRLVEATVLPETDIELHGLMALAAHGETARLRPALKRYHRRRMRVVAEIVRAVLRRQAIDPL